MRSPAFLRRLQQHRFANVWLIPVAVGLCYQFDLSFLRGIGVSAGIAALAILFRHGLARRLCLVPLAVAICYQLDWTLLRSATVSAVIIADHAVGVPVTRLGAVLFEVRGQEFLFTIGCTPVALFFSALPLLWDQSTTLVRNVSRLLLLFVALFALNVVRQTAGFFAFDRGLPWWLAHESLVGVTDFFFIFYVVRQGRWRLSAGRQRSIPLPSASWQPRPHILP